jgi:hypothetical protein
VSDEEGIRPGARDDQAAVEAEDESVEDESDVVPKAGIKKTRRLWVTVTAAVVLVVAAVIGAGWGWLAFATDRTAAAQRSVSGASGALSAITDERGMAIDKARATTSSMADFVAHPRPSYLAETTATALSKSQQALIKTSAKLSYVPFTPPRVSASSADLLPWTVIADVQRKHELARQETTLGRQRAAELASLEAAQEAFATSAGAVYRALAAHGEALMTADDSATYASRVALRHAIDNGKSDTSIAQLGGSGLLQIVAAIDGVETAQTAGEAEKQDPAYPVRSQIEAYADSIAHGVTLDFEWHEQVSGLGQGWYSGTTMYHEGDGGWATIDLNFEIQDGWADGDVDAKALVTHEVGHAQVVRPACKSLFEGTTFNSDDEMWATAWAISMGFDTAGSGISAYGRPSDQQIAVAGQCR